MRTNIVLDDDLVKEAFKYSGAIAWVAFNRIFFGFLLSSISHKEHISTPVTLAVTITISLRISSRYRSEVMARLISVSALMYLSYVLGVMFSIIR